MSPLDSAAALATPAEPDGTCQPIAAGRIASVIRASAANRAREASASASESLWNALQGTFAKFVFRRQCLVSGCHADFVCVEAALVIQIDGDGQTDYEARDTVMLAECGFRVLRFWNDEVLQGLDDVLAEVRSHLRRAWPSDRCGVLQQQLHVSAGPKYGWL
jgi:very-short-patch-repair endonuclease